MQLLDDPRHAAHVTIHCMRHRAGELYLHIASERLSCDLLQQRSLNFFSCSCSVITSHGTCSSAVLLLVLSRFGFLLTCLTAIVRPGDVCLTRQWKQNSAR